MNFTEEQLDALKKQMANDVQCHAVCGSGDGKEPEDHVLGCPRYSSGHSVDVDGNCNMGCC
jgi:hypothetical protein